MFDINTVLTQALNTAVGEAIKPLVQRIDQLEQRIVALNNQTQCVDTDLSALKESVADTIGELDTLKQRVAALENNPAIGVDTTLERRITALEGSKQISADAFVTHLDNQEWFWEKLTRKAGEAAQEVANQAVSDHCDEYGHDSYDSIVSTVEDHDLDDFVTRDDMRDCVEEIVGNARLTIKL